MYRPWKKALRSEEFIVTGVFFLGMLGASLIALGWPGKPRLLPLSICVFALVLLVMRIGDILFRGRGEAVGRVPWKTITGFVALVAVVPLTYAFSLAPAVGVLGISLTIIYGERRWWVILLFGISPALLIYFLFGKVFGIPLRF